MKKSYVKPETLTIELLEEMCAGVGTSGSNLPGGMGQGSDSDSEDIDPNEDPWGNSAKRNNFIYINGDEYGI